MDKSILVLKIKELLRWLWLSADFFIIWLTVYFLPSPMMSDDLRGLDELPLIYDIGWTPILLSFVYFAIWHNWKDVFFKTVIFLIATFITFDWHIWTLKEIFSTQMLQLIFSDLGAVRIIGFFLLMSISYTISIAIIKLKKKLFGNEPK